MLTIDEIKKKKEEYHYTYGHEKTSVPGSINPVVADGDQHCYDNMLEGNPDGKREEAAYQYDAPKARFLRESQASYTVNPRSALSWNTHVYPRQGTYTIDDYLALPDDQRVELIDGVIYDMGAPTSWHQLIAGEIFFELRNYIKSNHGSCVPFIAPTDVQLDIDNRTMVQPDVMVICQRDRVNYKRIFGAPDLVIEVLSPSTKVKDMLIKSAKYHNAGVQEYWMVDPGNETVSVFDFRDEDIRQALYTFEDRIPVLIYDGKLEIDMKEIAAYLKSIPQYPN